MINEDLIEEVENKNQREFSTVFGFNIRFGSTLVRMGDRLFYINIWFEKEMESNKKIVLEIKANWKCEIGKYYLILDDNKHIKRKNLIEARKQFQDDLDIFTVKKLLE